MNNKDISIIAGAVIGVAAIGITVLVKHGFFFGCRNSRLSGKEKKAIMPDRKPAHKKTQEIKDIIDQAKKTLSQLEDAIDLVGPDK